MLSPWLASFWMATLPVPLPASLIFGSSRLLAQVQLGSLQAHNSDVYSKRSSQFMLALAFAIALPLSAQPQPLRTILLIGPPGSGKTVQSEALEKAYKIPAISMAQLLRREVSRKSAMAKALAASVDSILSDDQANDLMKARILRPDTAHGFIIDGYPGTEGQARAFDQWLSELKLPKPIIVVLNVSEQVSRDRLTRRGRSADEPSISSDG